MIQSALYFCLGWAIAGFIIGRFAFQRATFDVVAELWPAVVAVLVFAVGQSWGTF